MKQRYLSSEERKQLVTTASALKTLNHTIDQLAARDREKRLLKHLRMARSWLDKAVDDWMLVMPLPEMKKMVEQSGNYNLVLTLKSEVKRTRQQMLKDTQIVPVDNEDLYDLVDASIDRCTRCTGENKLDCTLRRVLTKYEIPCYQEDATHCPYAYLDSEK